jgi:hypothetical protein
MQPTNGATWPEEKDGFGVVVMGKAGGDLKESVECPTSWTSDHYRNPARTSRLPCGGDRSTANKRPYRSAAVISAVGHCGLPALRKKIGHQEAARPSKGQGRLIA